MPVTDASPIASTILDAIGRTPVVRLRSVVPPIGKDEVMRWVVPGQYGPGYIGGQASDMRIQAEEIMKVKETICDIMARSTGKEKSRIEQDIERDRYMSAQEALAYGLVDEIIEEHKDPRKK